MYFTDPHLQFCFHHICPGYFKCHNSFCIPYRYVCDGTPDCPSGEEELKCDVLICRRLLKCKTDSICLSIYEVCDGIIHCPISKDDELLCDLPECPLGCRCYGLALKCFDVNLVPSYHSETRAIDISGDHILLTPSSFIKYIYLDRINLSSIQLINVPNGLFRNQKYVSLIDLSRNKLWHLLSHTWHGLRALYVLLINDNAIKEIRSFSFYGLMQLPLLDLSFQEISVLHDYSFYGLTHVADLNLANNNLALFSRCMFVGLTSLKFINMVGNHMTYIDEFAFLMIPIVTVLVDQNEICCFIVDHQVCHSVHEGTFSCTTLINNDQSRWVLIIVATIILMENIICIISVINDLRQSQSFICLLYMHITDSITGVILLGLVVLDKMFDKQFYFLASNWLHSTVCKIIGTIMVFVIECSFLSTLMIIIERYIIICHPFKVRHVIEKMFIPFHFYWVVALCPAILLVHFFSPLNTMCLQFTGISTDTYFWIFDGIFILVHYGIIIVMDFFIIKSMKAATHARKTSGRDLSRQDISLYRHMVGCMGVVILYGLVFLSVVIPSEIWHYLSKMTQDTLFIFIWSIPSILNPIIYTLTRSNCQACIE